MKNRRKRERLRVRDKDGKTYIVRETETEKSESWGQENGKR